MVNVPEDDKNIITNITERSSNSVLFENSSYIKEYTNSQLKHYKTTDLGLKVYKPLFLTKYLPELKQSAKRIFLTQREVDNYYHDPKRFSLEKLGSIDYWYIVLAINRMFSPSEFHGFENGVLVPDLNQVASIMTSIEKNIEENNKKLKTLSTTK